MAEYPKRPGFFAYRFCRLMGKACLANDVTPGVCWLLTMIAMTEDAKGYRGPVTFFNEQLMAVTGFNSADALDRARKKAVAAGWLHYQPGGKGIAGKYWVLVPDRFKGVDDAPSDETPSKYFRENAETNVNTSAKTRTEIDLLPHESGENPEASAERTRREPGRKCGENPEASAEHSSLTLPLTLPPTPRTMGEIIEIAKFDELIQAWKEVGLPGSDQIQRTSNRVGWFQQRLADESWRHRWREALRRAGRSARLLGNTPGWNGLRIDTFLKSADWVQRILEGEFDDAQPPPASTSNNGRDFDPMKGSAPIDFDAERSGR